MYINTTYNSSLFANPPDKREVVQFVYYDKRLPPVVLQVAPPYAPLGGRLIDFQGGRGPWYGYENDVPTGGAILLGRRAVISP